MSGLTAECLSRVVDGLAWFEGWEITVYDTPRQGTFVRVLAVGQADFRKPGCTTDLGIESEIPDGARRSEEAFLDWLGWRLATIARHESYEALRHRATNQPVFDPHAPGETSPR